MKHLSSERRFDVLFCLFMVMLACCVLPLFDCDDSSLPEQRNGYAEQCIPTLVKIGGHLSLITTLLTRKLQSITQSCMTPNLFSMTSTCRCTFIRDVSAHRIGLLLYKEHGAHVNRKLECHACAMNDDFSFPC